MAGYRCGYVVTHKNSGNSGGEFLQNMLKVQDTIPIGPPRISQHVALGALKQGMKKKKKNESSSSSSLYYSRASKKWVTKKYATLDVSREYILDAISALPQTVGGSGSMYVMGKLPDNLILTRTSTSSTTTTPKINNDDNGNSTYDSNDNNSDEISNNNDNNNSDENDNEPIDVQFCRLLIRDHGIAVIPGSFCGLEGWIRICYANLPPEQTYLASQRLKKGIDELINSPTKKGNETPAKENELPPK